MFGRPTIRGIAAVVSSSLLAVMLVAPAVVNAAPPGGSSRSVEVTASLTEPVTAGGISRFDVSATNSGKQNLSQSRLLIGMDPAGPLPAGASLLASVYGADAASCAVATDGASATCDFGSLRSRETRSVSFLVAFAQAGAAKVIVALKFAEQVNDQGSNQDTFFADDTAIVGETTCDSIATFIPPGLSKSLGTDSPSCATAPQITTLDIPAQANGALAAVGHSPTTACASGYSCFGEGSTVNVNNGADLGVLRWTISWDAAVLPIGFNIRQAGVVHFLDDGSQVVITNSRKNVCKSATQVDCLESFSFNADGTRLIAIVHTASNGVMRGLG